MVVSQERGRYRYRRLLLPHTIRRSVVADHAASTIDGVRDCVNDALGNCPL